MFNLIRKCFDSRSELQQIANDRNLILTGYGNEWLVFNSNGCILATASSQIEVMSIAIFGGN
jgi:hypothetical protein